MTLLLIVLGAAVAVVLISGLRVVREYERAVVFRLGRLDGVRGPGLYWLIPLGVERQRRVDLRTVTVSVERQETITKDSVTVRIDAVLWYRIVDPTKAIVEVVDYRNAVHQMAQTTLRNIIGQHALDEVLRARDSINDAIWKIVDGATAPWGVHVEAVEMKDVEIPQAMQRAMAREAEAIREKRARVIKAEAELESSEKLAAGAHRIAQDPIALELRRMQMLTEIGAEQHSSTIVLMPSDFVLLAREVASSLAARRPEPAPAPPSGDGA